MDETVVDEIVEYLETREDAGMRQIALNLSGRTAYGRDNLDERYPAATITTTVQELAEEGVLERDRGDHPMESPTYRLADSYEDELDGELAYDDAGAGGC